MCMCEHPICVKNPSRKFGDGMSKTHFLVPCGQCASCRAQMQEDWFQRAWIEYKEFVENKGRVLFVTLTYRPSCLPKLDIENDKLVHGDDKKGVKCFDDADIKTYLNTLRKRFERKGITGLKYFICSEFGLTEGKTKRPHYHGLIYVPKCRLSDIEVADIVKSSWFNGWCFFSDAGCYIKNESAIKYVSKYVCKDLDFYGQQEIKDIQCNKMLRKKYHRFMPKHYQSKGFGGDLARWLLHKEDCFEYFKNGLGQEYYGTSVDRFYQIPRYVRDKILYHDVNGVRYPSVIGKNILMRLFDYRLEQSNKSLRKFFIPLGLYQLIDDEDAYKIIPIYRQLDYENNRNGVRSYLIDLLNNRSVTELSLYKKVFCNRSLYNETTEADIQEFNECDVETLSVFAHMLYDDEINGDDYFAISDEPWKEKIDMNAIPTYNHFTRFKDFDELLEAINKIQGISSARRQAKKDAEYKITNKLKNTLK